jgi:hypothetical protein
MLHADASGTVQMQRVHSAGRAIIYDDIDSSGKHLVHWRKRAECRINCSGWRVQISRANVLVTEQPRWRGRSSHNCFINSAHRDPVVLRARSHRTVGVVGGSSNFKRRAARWKPPSSHPWRPMTLAGNIRKKGKSLESSSSFHYRVQTRSRCPERDTFVLREEMSSHKISRAISIPEP